VFPKQHANAEPNCDAVTVHLSDTDAVAIPDQFAELDAVTHADSVPFPISEQQRIVDPECHPHAVSVRVAVAVAIPFADCLTESQWHC